MHQDGDHLFYTFVDLNWGEGVPKVFVVPSKVVYEQMNDGFERKMFMMWITAGEEKDYLERWDLIDSALSRRE